MKFIIFQDRADRIDETVNDWMKYLQIKIISTNQTESFDGDGNSWVTISIFYCED